MYHLGDPVVAWGPSSHVQHEDERTYALTLARTHFRSFLLSCFLALLSFLSFLLSFFPCFCFSSLRTGVWRRGRVVGEVMDAEHVKCPAFFFQAPHRDAVSKFRSGLFPSGPNIPLPCKMPDASCAHPEDSATNATEVASGLQGEPLLSLSLSASVLLCSLTSLASFRLWSQCLVGVRGCFFFLSLFPFVCLSVSVACEMPFPSGRAGTRMLPERRKEAAIPGCPRPTA